MFWPRKRQLARLKKQLNGIELANLDSDIRANFYLIDHTILAPSKLKNIIISLSSLIIPLSLLSSALILVFSAYKTINWISDELSAQAEAIETLSSDYAEPDLDYKQFLTQNINPLRPITVKEKEAELNFISGIIAIQRPEHSSGGKVAKNIVSLSHQEEIDPFYVTAMVSTESRFLPTARSHKNAVGLMQLLPATAKELYQLSLGKKDTPKLHDPKTNLRLGILYIKELERRYKGNRFLALAAYNWGPSNVDHYRHGRRSLPRSVKRYATKILEKTHRWRKHFERSFKATSSMSAVSQNTNPQTARKSGTERRNSVKVK